MVHQSSTCIVQVSGQIYCKCAPKILRSLKNKYLVAVPPLLPSHSYIQSGIVKPQSQSLQNQQLSTKPFTTHLFYTSNIFFIFGSPPPKNKNPIQVKPESIRAHFHPRWINHPSAFPWRRPASSSSSSPPSCSSPCQAFSCGCSGTPTASVAAGAKKQVARWDKL